MPRRQVRSQLRAPFLRRMALRDDIDRAAFKHHPLNLPLFRTPFELEFDAPITILVGANGSGKSTIIEAIVAACGFSLSGGTRHVAHMQREREALSQHLRFSWLPKVHQGFFFRAETFSQLAETIDEIAAGDPGAYDAYGGVSLRARSHGLSLMAVFENRFGARGVYVMDEPEGALSPDRLLDFIAILRRLEQSGQAQVIMATHSPMLMAYPGAALIEVSDSGLRPVRFEQTRHFKLMRDFVLDPTGFMRAAITRADEGMDDED